MAEVYSLEAQARTVIGKHVKALRRQDLIPAVIYGAGDVPVHISCPRRPLEIVLAQAGGTHLINVLVEGATHNALVREVQRDKVKRNILHVDFMRVDLTRKLRTEVPLVFVGEPKLASDLMLTHNIQSIQVECLPTDIPDHIDVDMTNLTTLGAQIAVADLARIPNVEYLADPHEVLVRVDAQAAAEPEEEVAVAEEAAAAVPAEPEVIEKGKKEEEEEF
jgi:large subunit ribosomal protein L25